jgi:hypothetical protein
MSNRRRLARERLEIYLVHLLLAYRRLIFIAALLLLTYAIAILVIKPLLGVIGLLPALYLLLLSHSYTITVHTARAAAWISTLGNHDE